MNKSSLSVICQSAVIVDLQDNSVYPYADLEIKLETPGMYCAATHEASRA